MHEELSANTTLISESNSDEPKACLFVELDPFSSTFPQNISSINKVCVYLKLACIYFDVVDINADVYSHNPIALSVFRELKPLVRNASLWPSAARDESPLDFITRKIDHYARRSAAADKDIILIEEKWAEIIPNDFKIHRFSTIPQIKSAISSIEDLFLESKKSPFYTRIWDNLQDQKYNNIFDREDTITNLAFVSRSFSSETRPLAELVSAEYIYQGTTNKNHSYTLFPGPTGRKVCNLHPKIRSIGFDTKHIKKLHRALILNNLSPRKLITLPVEQLSALISDDAFRFFRKNYQWPLDDLSNGLQDTRVQAAYSSEKPIELKRTVKSSYFLPIFSGKNINTTSSYISINRNKPEIYINDVNEAVNLTLDEHNLFILLGYNDGSRCTLDEALQQLIVSRDMDLNRKNRTYDKSDILSLRAVFDSKIISPFNLKMKPFDLQLETKNGLIRLILKDNQCEILLFRLDKCSTDIEEVRKYAVKMRSSRAKKLLLNIENFITPIHASFVAEFILSVDNTVISKSVHLANQVLKKYKLKIYQPSRGYYLLKKLT